LVKRHNLKGRILAKLEYYNPGGSKKDRFARQVIEDLEKSGKLKPGQTVVELTSGNTGTGLAIICAIKGYPFVAVISKGNSIERVRMMTSFGAEVVLVDQSPGSKVGEVSGEDLQLVEKKAQEVVKERGALRTDQFKLESNIRAHELGTGPEAWEQSQKSIEVFADFCGTAGTFTGCARFFKKVAPSAHCYAIEPQTARFLETKKAENSKHKIQGGGYSRELPLFDRSLAHGFIGISDEEATETARELAKVEGIFGGFSSGANVAAALKLLKNQESGKTVFVLVPDTGLKYLSTDLYP
jgi:cysteine synthase